MAWIEKGRIPHFRIWFNICTLADVIAHDSDFIHRRDQSTIVLIPPNPMNHLFLKFIVTLWNPQSRLLFFSCMKIMTAVIVQRYCQCFAIWMLAGWRGEASWLTRTAIPTCSGGEMRRGQPSPHPLHSSWLLLVDYHADPPFRTVVNRFLELLPSLCSVFV